MGDEEEDIKSDGYIMNNDHDEDVEVDRFVVEVLDQYVYAYESHHHPVAPADCGRETSSIPGEHSRPWHCYPAVQFCAPCSLATLLHNPGCSRPLQHNSEGFRMANSKISVMGG